MEEKKSKMAPVKEPTVDELKNYCSQLLAQRNQLAEELREATNVLNKLPILFEIIKIREVFPEEFIKACVNEVMITLMPSKEEKKEEEKQKEVPEKN